MLVPTATVGLFGVTLDVKRPTRRSATPDSPEVLLWEISR